MSSVCLANISDNTNRYIFIDTNQNANCTYYLDIESLQYNSQNDTAQAWVISIPSDVDNFFMFYSYKLYFSERKYSLEDFQYMKNGSYDSDISRAYFLKNEPYQKRPIAPASIIEKVYLLCKSRKNI